MDQVDLLGAATYVHVALSGTKGVIVGYIHLQVEGHSWFLVNVGRGTSKFDKLFRLIEQKYGVYFEAYIIVLSHRVGTKNLCGLTV